MTQQKLSVDQALALAKSHAAKGETEQARQLYSDILKISPKNKKAKKCLKALKNKTAQVIRTELTQTQIDHLNALYSLGKIKDALEEARRLSRTNPDIPFLYNMMGACYFELGHPDTAITNYKRALKIDPDNIDAHINIGNILGILGQSDAAAASFERALEVNPDHAGAHYNLSALKKYKPGDPQMELIEDLLSSPEIGESDRMLLCFALAKAYEDLGNYDKSFDYLKEANRLRKKELNYDIGDDRRIFSITKEIFNTESVPFADIPAGKSSSILPVFIIGMPRSGTSLVEQILASHSKVYGAGELTSFTRLLTPLFSNFRPQAMIGQQNTQRSRHDIQSIRNGYLEALAALDVPEKIITDKMPLNFRWTGFILRALPEAKIIHLNRDPRATCWSIYKHYFAGKGNGFAYDMEDLAAFYKLYMDLMAYWNAHFPGKIYNLYYEDLTETQEEETRKLLDYCGLEWEDACLNFHKVKRAVKTTSSAQVRQKMYKGSSEAWKIFETHLQPLISSLEN